MSLFSVFCWSSFRLDYSLCSPWHTFSTRLYHFLHSGIMIPHLNELLNWPYFRCYSLFAISLFASCRMFSIGFKSEECPDHGKSFMFFWIRNSFTLLAVWQGAPSCIKIKFSSLENHSTWGMNLFSRSVMYWSRFIVPWTKYRLSETFPDIWDHSITEVGWLTALNHAPQFQIFVFISFYKLPFVLQTLERWFVRKAYLRKVQYFCQNEKLRNPISIILYYAHY